MDKKEIGSFWGGVALLALIMFLICSAPGCATYGGPTTVINPASGQVIDVPAGNKVMIVSPSGGYYRQTDTRLQQEIVRAGVDHHAINSRQKVDLKKLEVDAEENQLRFKSDVAREVSRGIQNFQRERSYRSRNRQEAWGEAISRSVEIKPLKLNLNRLKRR